MLLTSSLLPVVHGFSTREGGVSLGALATLNLGRSVGDGPERVAENARRLARRAGLTPGQLVSANQVHGDRILRVDGATAGDALPAALGDADGLMTRARGVALCVRTADCVPVLLFAPDVPAVAAVHAGWRGALLAIPGKAVRELKDGMGADPAALVAAGGPSIRQCCYEVSEELARQFTDRFGDGLVARQHEGGPHLDIAGAARRALLEAGGQEKNVDVLAHCTCCDEARFFSHRRDHGRTGRHLSLVALGQ
jgi:polyphenol oxidase